MGYVPHYETSNSPYRIQVLDRAFAALEVLADRRGDISLVELCNALTLHKSTVHRLMMVLEGHRLVEKHPDSGRYRLGLRLFELGSKAISVVDLREHAHPFLSQVMSETQETVHLCILDQDALLYVEKLEPQRSVRLASRVGWRAPAYCTSVGKAILAELVDAEVNAIVRRSGLKRITPHTITTPAGVKMELKSIRERGYAIDNEENEEGVRCVGVAVRDHTRRPVAAISVSGPAFRFGSGNIGGIARSLRQAAEALSYELGYSTTEAAAFAVR